MAAGKNAIVDLAVTLAAKHGRSDTGKNLRPTTGRKDGKKKGTATRRQPDRRKGR